MHRAWQEGRLLYTEQPELDELQRKIVWLLGMPEASYRAQRGRGRPGEIHVQAGLHVRKVGYIPCRSLLL